MPPEFGGFRPKPPEELSSQIAGANAMLEADETDQITPPSIPEEGFLSMPLAEIQQKYARRYEMYLRIVRDLKRPLTEEDLTTITEAEVQEMRRWLKALNSLDTYIRDHQKGNGEKTLRGKQVNVFEDLRNFLEAGGTNGYVKLPTGFGKTVLFIEFIEALDLRTLIVVPTKELIAQTEGKFGQFAPDLDIGKVYQNAKEFNRQVTICSGRVRQDTKSG